MPDIVISLALPIGALVWATPAWAGAMGVDAPGNILLFGLGLTGLLPGRQISKGRIDRDADESG